ncbi:hypothetical protein L218DRAFT_415706 [Marasmius fiardii PR-910]|nr:hypothetical protein L218DRAFT_415706 [Marasmius fiardii PR-910]
MSDAESFNGDRDRETLDDPNLWEISSASSEEWNEDAEWTVEIVGEEVRNKKIRHEVVWHGWQRPTDGTSNTWPWNPEEEGINTNEWERLAAKRRKDLAKQSTKLNVWSDTSLVDTDTRLRSQAYEEKLNRSKERSLKPASRSRNNLQRHGRGRNSSAERSDGESSPPPRPVSHRRRPVAASRSSGSVSSSVSQSLPSSSTAAASDRPVSTKRSRLSAASRSSVSSPASQNRPSLTRRDTAAASDRPTSSTSQSRSSRQPVRSIASKSPPHLRQTQESDEEDYVHRNMVERFYGPPYLPSKRKQREDPPDETVRPKPTSKEKGKACPQPQPSRIRSAIEQTASHSARKVANLPVRAQETFRTSSAPFDSSELPRKYF